MGSYFHMAYTPFQQFFNGKQLRAVVLGFDAVGKTTLLYKLNIGEVIFSVPTIGFNIETVQFQKVKLVCWDLGGCRKIKQLQQHYYRDINAIIFMVDLSDKERIDEVRSQLEIILSQEVLKDAPLLVFANKKDLHIMKSQEMPQKLGLSKIKGRNWKIQETCAVEGDGLREGFQWICEATSKKQ